MNKERRKQIAAVVSQIETALTQLEALRDEEQDYMDNMPESLQGSTKYEDAEQAVSDMDEALDGLQEASNTLGNIQ